MAITVLPINAASGAPAYSAQATRQAFSAFLGAAPVGRPLGAASGVRAGTPSTTVTLTGASATTWNVAAHSGVVDAETAIAGPYLYATDGSDTGTITAANATNPRIDIIYVQINDTDQDGSGLRGGVVGYLAGTAAATPSAPAAPARSIVLANISVPKAGAGSPAVTWVAPIFDDTGWIMTGFTAQTGYSVSSAAIRRAGRVVSATVNYSLTASQTFASTAGNIIDQAICTLPFIPTQPAWGSGIYGSNAATFRVDTSGMLWCTNIGGSGASQTFSSGTTGQAQVMFFYDE